MEPTRPYTLFQAGWKSFGLPGHRPCRGTYERYPSESIPPIPEEQLTGTLQWLVPLDSKVCPGQIRIGKVCSVQMSST